jgi:hypothetical protein
MLSKKMLALGSIYIIMRLIDYKERLLLSIQFSKRPGHEANLFHWKRTGPFSPVNVV